MNKFRTLDQKLTDDLIELNQAHLIPKSIASRHEIDQRAREMHEQNLINIKHLQNILNR